MFGCKDARVKRLLTHNDTGRHLTFSGVRGSRVLFTDEEGSKNRRSGRVTSGGYNWPIEPLRIYFSGFVTRQKHNSDAAQYSPPLVPHAPRLSRAALLPHFYHACEGLHTWLPLGERRHLPLRTHIGPRTKTAWKQTRRQHVIRVFN